MKKFFGCLVLAVVFTACGSDGENGKDGKPGAGKKSDRNFSITKENAYSNLFLDSLAVEKFMVQQKFNDTLTEEMRLFYNLRNFQFAWFSSAGATEQMLSFRSLYDYSKDNGETRKSLDNRLDDILTTDSLGTLRANPSLVKTELLMTWRFLNYLSAKHTRKGPRNKALANMIPSQKTPAIKLAEKIVSGGEEDAGMKTKEYSAMKEKLGKYLERAKNGGFAKVATPKRILKEGDKNNTVKQIKIRLAQEGLFPGNDTSENFSPELKDVVKKSQERYGLKADGRIGTSLVKELNVPAEKRLETILVNLERIRWMPGEPTGRMIVVNIPEFRLHVRDGATQVFDMDIVVGKEGSNTINFSGNLNQVVFNPYWNVPRSIVSKEVVPGMEKNDYYLEDHHMEMTGEEDGLPVIRQLPGDHNALGRVKFLFPNSFNIYFHDTPEKELFKRTKRAYSHGCIRLAEPMKMANYLLEEDVDWSSTRVDSVLATDKEKYVKVKTPVPVVIAYYTAWVNENGELAFRDDIYGHDKKLGRMLFGKADPKAAPDKLAVR